MTAAERRALLGDAVIEHIADEVDDAPAPTPEVLDALRPILTRPAVAPAPAPAVADAA